MDDVKKKILERLKKLSEEEKEKREQIQEAKFEGGDSPDNQDYQFTLESLMRIRQEKSSLQSRLEEMEKEEAQIQEKKVKSKGYRKTSSFPIVGKEFELLVNNSKNIRVKIVPLYEEIENKDDYYCITTDSPLSKVLEKIIERFLVELEKKIEKIITYENDPKKIADAIKNMNEWIAIPNHSKFTKRVEELSKDKNKLLRELESFIKQAEVDNSKIFEAIREWEFNLKIQEKDVKYKILNVN